MDKLNIDGHSLVYRTAGNPANPPVILVHGWVSHQGIWRTTIPALEKDFYCITFDLLGLADSDKPADADYSIPAQARRVVKVADALGVDKFTLIGHSMGGQIVMETAANIAPERVTQLVNVAGVASGDLHWYLRYAVLPRLYMARPLPFLYYISRLYNRFKPAFRMENWNWFYDFDALPFEDWAVDRHYSLLPSAHIPNILTYNAIRARDLTPDLKKTQCPTLIIFGRQDYIVPYPEGELTAKHIPGAKLVTIEQCGHFSMLEKREEYLTALREFLVKQRV